MFSLLTEKFIRDSSHMLSPVRTVRRVLQRWYFMLLLLKHEPTWYQGQPWDSVHVLSCLCQRFFCKRLKGGNGSCSSVFNTSDCLKKKKKQREHFRDQMWFVFMVGSHITFYMHIHFHIPLCCLDKKKKNKNKHWKQHMTLCFHLVKMRL